MSSESDDFEFTLDELHLVDPVAAGAWRTFCEEQDFVHDPTLYAFLLAERDDHPKVMWRIRAPGQDKASSTVVILVNGDVGFTHELD